MLGTMFVWNMLSGRKRSVVAGEDGIKMDVQHGEEQRAKQKTRNA